MSTQPNPEIVRAAGAKAIEGASLLNSGDYDGSIAACTESIELNPGQVGAYRTRAQAYRKLGRTAEADADLAHGGDSVSEETGAFVICQHLRQIGVYAYPAGQTSQESGDGDDRNKSGTWRIGIANSPIHEIFIVRNQREEVERSYSDDFSIGYLIPDDRLSSVADPIELNSTRVRRWIFGAFTGVRWNGHWPGVIEVLDQDDAISAAILNDKADIEIEGSYVADSWGIFYKESFPSFNRKIEDAVAKYVPSRQMWECYEAIAGHLLSTPISE